MKWKSKEEIEREKKEQFNRNVDLSKIEKTYSDTAQPIATVSDVGDYFKVSLSREITGKWETITFYRNKTMPIEQVEALYLERINEMFVFANAPEFFMYQQIETTIPPLTEMIFKLGQEVDALKGGN